MSDTKTVKDLEAMKKAYIKSEKNKKYQKEYYAKNKTKMLENLCEKTTCELCGRSVCKYYMTKHLTSKVCKNTVNRKKLIEEKKKEYFENK